MNKNKKEWEEGEVKSVKGENEQIICIVDDFSFIMKHIP